jgi:hypothetical protein
MLLKVLLIHLTIKWRNNNNFKIKELPNYFVCVWMKIIKRNKNVILDMELLFLLKILFLSNKSLYLFNES